MGAHDGFSGPVDLIGTAWQFLAVIRPASRSRGADFDNPRLIFARHTAGRDPRERASTMSRVGDARAEGGSDAFVAGPVARPDDSALASAPDPFRSPNYRRIDATGCATHPNGCVVHLLGTSHVSETSATEVRELIRVVRPDVVVLELCESRRSLMYPRPRAPPPTFAQMVRSIRGGVPAWGVLYGWTMAKVGEELGVTPGDEFRAAREVAERQGARLVLGDRPVRVTLARTWRALSTWERVRFAWLLLVSGVDVLSADQLRKHIDALSDSDVVTEALREMADEFPSMMRPLIDERDEYMVATLRGAAAGPGVRDVVAVVGRGHCDGIEARWNDARIDPVELERMPETTKGVGVGAYVWVRRAAVCAAATVVVLRLTRRR